DFAIRKDHAVVLAASKMHAAGERPCWSGGVEIDGFGGGGGRITSADLDHFTHVIHNAWAVIAKSAKFEQSHIAPCAGATGADIPALPVRPRLKNFSIRRHKHGWIQWQHKLSCRQAAPAIGRKLVNLGQ